MRTFYRFRRLLVATLLAFAPPAPAADLPGSADYPQIGRFENSEIVKYEAANYGETTLATAPVQKRSDIDGSSKRVEGEVTRIVYRVPPGNSALEVFRNFESRVEEAGYDPLFSGGPNSIDKYVFTYRHPVEIIDETSLGNEIWYLSAKRSGEGREDYLSLLVSPHSGGDGLRVRLIGAATKAMENRMLDASAMRSAIAESGRVALYGIYFDTDSARIKPESAPTLEQIAELLRDSAGLSLIVVGHTDNRGDFDYNRNLSRKRARAVARSLADEYGIEASRLRHEGVGYLAPAASNDSADGRARNRRVELVKEK